MFISFVIPTLNEEERIENLLISIKLQQGIKLNACVEIIIVDNGSVDKTVELSKKYADAVYILPKVSIAALRNFGVEKAKGDIVVFADADNVLSKNTLQDISKLFNCTEIGILGPNGLIPYEGNSWVQNTWYIHTKKVEHHGELFEIDSTGSGFMVIEKCIFDKVKGFNILLLVGEDTDLCNRVRSAGYSIYKSNSLHIFNSGHPKSILKFIKREFWHGDSFGHIIRHKRVDLNTVYLFFNSFIVIGMFLAMISNFSSNILIPLFVATICYTIIPSLIKAFSKRKRTDIVFCRLFLLYLIYIYTRTIALYKI